MNLLMVESPNLPFTARPFDYNRNGGEIGHRQKEPIVTIVVNFRHMDVSPALKAFAEQKVNKLPHYYDRIQEIEVIFDANNKTAIGVEVIVNAEHKNMFIAHCLHADAYAGLDECTTKLERQLSDHKKKHRNHKHDAADKHIAPPAV